MSGRHHHRTRLVHKAQPSPGSVRNDINVTPLVDVCLVLLIIFMVVGQMLERGKAVPVPKTNHHEVDNDEGQPIVAIDTRGRIYVGTEEVPDLDVMKQRVEQGLKEMKGSWKVFVKVAIDVPYKKVYPVIMALHDMGIPTIDLGTTRADGAVE
ncbi:MAG TPA: biopolymer transporter ExbD [Kofleriaceae bacterium]|nr:biopolymer transporter ExbD [Kofleriaceae bacterium]